MPIPSTYTKGQVVVGAQVVADPVVYGNVVCTTQGIQAGGGVPTVTALTPAGLAAAVSSQVGTDQAGSFVLTAGTAANAGGTQLSVTFATPLPVAPASVNVNVADTTSAATTTLAWGATGYSTTGFTIFGGATTASHTYLVSYQVYRQQG